MSTISQSECKSTVATSFRVRDLKQSNVVINHPLNKTQLDTDSGFLSRTKLEINKDSQFATAFIRDFHKPEAMTPDQRFRANNT